MLSFTLGNYPPKNENSWEYRSNIYRNFLEIGSPTIEENMLWLPWGKPACKQRINRLIQHDCTASTLYLLLYYLCRQNTQLLILLWMHDVGYITCLTYFLYTSTKSAEDMVRTSIANHKSTNITKKPLPHN